MYVLTLKNGEQYTLADNGAVIDRTDGPRGWDYSGQWLILGFTKRHHSARMVSLAAAAAGADIGQGWVHDLDHGHRRMWAMPTDRRAKAVRHVR